MQPHFCLFSLLIGVLFVFKRYNGLEKLGAPIRWIRLRSDKGCRRRIHGEKATKVHPGV